MKAVFQCYECDVRTHFNSDYITQCRDFSYERYCKAFKALFSEIISVLCFGQGSYEPPQPDLTVYLMERIFHRDRRTQEMTALSWEQADDEPVVRSLLPLTVYVD